MYSNASTLNSRLASRLENYEGKATATRPPILRSASETALGDFGSTEFEAVEKVDRYRRNKIKQTKPRIAYARVEYTQTAESDRELVPIPTVSTKGSIRRRGRNRSTSASPRGQPRELADSDDGA